MALTAFQRDVVRILADAQEHHGYIAGAAALNVLTGASRISEDLDIFHDAADAVQSAFVEHRRLLEAAGVAVTVLRQWPRFVEALIERNGEFTRLQWAHDSAFRFFPLLKHEELGLTLHAFDLAVNKVLALVGRAEPRDWVDVIECHTRVQPLGYLVWAASGKDPGLSPSFILNEAARTGRYTAEELAPLAFEGKAPDAVTLAVMWHAMLREARELTAILPAREVGTCVCRQDGALMLAGPSELREALASGTVLFHRGRLYGAWPTIA